MAEDYSRCEPLNLAFICLMTCLDFISEHLEKSGKSRINPKEVLIETLKELIASESKTKGNPHGN